MQTSTSLVKEISRYISLFVLLAVITAAGCTTLDFESPSKKKDVFRLKLENVGDREIRYSPEVSMFYIDGKESIDVPDSTIAPGDEPHIVFESESGAFGISADIRLRPGGTVGRLILEKGTGTGDNFELDEVVKTNTNNFIVFLRYGEIY